MALEHARLLLTTGPLHLLFPLPGLPFPPFIPCSTQILPPQGGFPRFPRHDLGTLFNTFTAPVTTCPYVIYVVACCLSPLPECQVPEGRNFCHFCLQLYLQHLEQSLAHSSC